MPLFGHAVRRIPVASIAAGFLLLASHLHAADLPAPVTLDVPIPVNRALPAWIGQPETPATIFGTLNLPILPPDSSSSLLVTVYFQERQGGFLRLIWKGAQNSELLTDNFYENIGMANQRSLLISPDTMIGDGTLEFQSSDPKLGIQRIKLEWLESKSALVSPEIRDTLVTAASGQTQPSAALNGAPPTTAAGAWDNLIVTVPMTDTPVRIEQGVDFSIDLDQAPNSARVSLDESGLPLGKRIVVWVNEQRAGTMTPAVPDLLDQGYLATDSKGTTGYVGWRAASFYPPVSLLKAGVNTLQFSVEDDATATPPATVPDQSAPLAIKNLVMQLNYTPTLAGTFTLTPLTSAAPAPTVPVEAAAVQTAAIAPLATPPGLLAPVPETPAPDALPDLPLPQLMAPVNPSLRSVESVPTP
jgi:hypothetical protein